MDFKEVKNNYYTRELNKIDRYLLRIIKRYFDLEEINSAASINAIIAEAIARYKATINYENKGVDTLNDKFGIVNINITDLNGEKRFEKLTAFNKDFGTEYDNICMGNDERLFDDRNPKEHHHKITDVKELRTILDNFKKEIGKYGVHIHYNIAILDKLKYTGTNTQIDLTKLESLGSIVNELLYNLDRKKHNLLYLFESNEPIVQDLINQIYYFMQKLYGFIEAYNKDLNNLLVGYVKEKEKVLNDIKEDIERNYCGVDELNEVIRAYNNTLSLLSIQEIDLASALEVVVGTVSSNQEDSMRDMYDNSSVIGVKSNGVLSFTHTVNKYSGTAKTDRWDYDNTLGTFVCKVNESEHLMFLSANEYKRYTHEVTLTSNDGDNDVITIILAAKEIEGQGVYTLSLNVSMGLDEFTDNPHRMCIISGYQTEFQEEVCYDETFNPTQTSWSGNSVRVKIVRNDNKFRIYRSNINSNTVNTRPCMEFDLDDVGDGHLYKDESRFGYGCLSQNNSQFLDVSFAGYKSIQLTDDIEKQESINFSVLPSDYVIDSMEIEPELVYNNTRTKLPYITEDFIISAGTMDNKLYVKFQSLNPEVILPLEITIGKIMYNIYSKRNIEEETYADTE